MKLSELRKGDKAVIQKIETDEGLRSRLNSFGVGRGSELTIENCSMTRQTVEILVDGTYIGLRAKEAADIEVEKI